MSERCYVCHDPVPLFGTLHVGGPSDGEEMALCPECASLVFPGMRDAMIANCPVCEMNARHN
jgi:hypothetical protein